MTRNLQALLTLQPQRQRWLLAFGLTLTASVLATHLTARGWAENYPLDSVDFTSNGGQTSIVLHTGSIVPVQKVFTSDTKLILDIDQITPDETVRTNFAGASNISHVILQPLQEHKMRLIVRGESLGTPTIAFSNGGSAGLYSESNHLSGALEHESASTLNQSSAPAHATPKESVSLPGLDARHTLNASQPAPTGLIPPDKTAPLPLHSNEPPPPLAAFFIQLLSGQYNWQLSAGLAVVFIIGMLKVMRKQLVRVAQGGSILEEELDDSLAAEPNPSGKRASFREMAEAYRHKTATQRKQTASDEIIGLRAFQEKPAPIQQSPANPPETPAINPALTLEQMISAMHAASNPAHKAIKTPPAPKQAIQQYVQTPTPKTKPKSRQIADELMVKEMKRAQTLQQELLKQAKQMKTNEQSANSQQLPPIINKKPTNQAPAAQKNIKTPQFQSAPKPTRNPAAPTRGAAIAPQAQATAASAKPPQGPLPGNPEVLNFLRNVAELMEKDGKGQIAKNIHKKLTPHNLGM